MNTSPALKSLPQTKQIAGSSSCDLKEASEKNIA